MSTTTKAAAHTPGPWNVSDEQKYALEIVAPWSETLRPDKSSGYGDYRGHIVCKIEHQNDNPCVSKEQAEANARLIAAAPEMLEALEELTADVKACFGGVYRDLDGKLDRALAAIQKARGGQ